MPISLVPSRTDIIILENTHSNLRSHSTVVLLRQNHEMENKNHFYVKKIEIRWLLGKKRKTGTSESSFQKPVSDRQRNLETNIPSLCQQDYTCTHTRAKRPLGRKYDVPTKGKDSMKLECRRISHGKKGGCIDSVHGK